MPEQLKDLINAILDYQKVRIMRALLGRSPKRKPSFNKKKFKIAAQDAIKKIAKDIFKRMVKPYTKISFRNTESLNRKISKFSLFLAKIREKGVKRLIYVYYGCKEKEKCVIYVGQAKGRGGRAHQHKKFFRKYNITMVRLYKVKKGKKYLDAAECAGIHAYSPLGKEFPLENRIKSPRRRKMLHCKICKSIRKSRKIAQELAKY